MTERGLKKINVFIQRLQTFFFIFVTFLRFLVFFWNVFYIYVGNSPRVRRLADLKLNELKAVLAAVCALPVFLF